MNWLLNSHQRAWNLMCLKATGNFGRVLRVTPRSDPARIAVCR